MKRLYLLRHAHTHGASPGGSDAERHLTAQGLADANRLAAYMRRHSDLPAVIYCSPARRTRETCNALIQGGITPSVIYKSEIYEKGLAEILAMIHGCDNTYDSLLVIGHNPSMHELAAKLASTDGLTQDNHLHSLTSLYSPATLAVFDCPRASWRDLQMGINHLRDLWTPETGA